MLTDRMSDDWRWCCRRWSSLIRGFVVLCCLSMCGLSALAAEQTGRPNIILMVADDKY